MKPWLGRPWIRITGVIVVIAMVAAVGTFVFRNSNDDGYRIAAYFPRAVSVFKSSDVRVLGLPAGSVTGVTVEGDKVRIDMHIKGSIDIPSDATAQIVPQSLIGERYIQLSPAFKTGMTRAKDGLVIPVERTITPVEPDEALAAIKKFLDSLDPKGIGKLVTNLNDDLEGNGAKLNDTIGSLSTLVATFADKDEALQRITDSFDRLTSTLSTREVQLGQVLDAFAQATQVLADERGSIEGLVTGLADLSQHGLELVGKHAGALRSDVQTLADTAAVIDANLTSVTQLLDAGGTLVTGIKGAYNPSLRAINLRNSFTPLVDEVIQALIGQLGVPAICLPVTVTCVGAASSAGSPTPASITPAVSPVAALLELLSQPTAIPGDSR